MRESIPQLPPSPMSPDVPARVPAGVDASAFAALLAAAITNTHHVQAAGASTGVSHRQPTAAGATGGDQQKLVAALVSAADTQPAAAITNSPLSTRSVASRLQTPPAPQAVGKIADSSPSASQHGGGLAPAGRAQSSSATSLAGLFLPVGSPAAVIAPSHDRNAAGRGLRPELWLTAYKKTGTAPSAEIQRKAAVTSDAIPSDPTARLRARLQATEIATSPGLWSQASEGAQPKRGLVAPDFSGFSTNRQIQLVVASSAPPPPETIAPSPAASIQRSEAGQALHPGEPLAPWPDGLARLERLPLAAEAESQAETSQPAAVPTRPAALSAPTATAFVRDLPLLAVHALAAGRHALVVALEPAALGRVQLTFEFAPDGRVSLRLRAEKAEALERLQRETANFTRIFAAHGFRLDVPAVSFAQLDRDGDLEQDPAAGRHPRAGDSARPSSGASFVAVLDNLLDLLT